MKYVVVSMYERCGIVKNSSLAHVGARNIRFEMETKKTRDCGTGGPAGFGRTFRSNDEHNDHDNTTTLSDRAALLCALGDSSTSKTTAGMSCRSQGNVCDLRNHFFC